MSHGWGCVEPSVNDPANDCSSVAGWASRAWGWLSLSPSPARTPLSSPHYCTSQMAETSTSFIIRSFWPKVALWKEDKPLCFDVRNSWLQNDFFVACHSDWDCYALFFIIIIIKIEIDELDFRALSFAASEFLPFSSLMPLGMNFPNTAECPGSVFYLMLIWEHSKWRQINGIGRAVGRAVFSTLP